MVKALREAKEWSRADLARKARITTAYVSLLESGKKKNPSPDVVKRLAQALGVPAKLLGMGPCKYPSCRRERDVGPDGICSYCRPLVDEMRRRLKGRVLLPAHAPIQGMLPLRQGSGEPCSLCGKQIPKTQNEWAEERQGRTIRLHLRCWEIWSMDGVPT